MTLVAWFDDAVATDVAVVGGKFCGLTALAGVGVSVPPAFCVTTAAYREALTATGIDARIGPLLEAVDPARPETGERASADLCAIFDEHPLPARVGDAIAAAYGELCAAGGAGDVAVAVRSSATAEDLAEASFAGQQDTFLNVTGASAVAESVAACWRSLYSARAIQYRATRGEGLGGELAMAVVVQVLIPARASGVMFTSSPLAADGDQVLIEGSWGLGEAVVAGLVTPDRFLVDKRTGRTSMSRVAQKTVRVVRSPIGTVEEEVPAAYQCMPCLTARDRRELAELGARVEASFGSPQDIEWAIDDNGERHLLQARPVTALARADQVTEGVA
jgi:rifampicin phosphotransferase